MRLFVRILFVCTLFISVTACDDNPETPTTRTYRMGFQNSAPRFDDPDMALQSLNMWTIRADAAIISTEVPWKKILEGTDPVDYVVENYKDLVAFYREKNFKLWVYIDPTNALDRTSDSRELVDAGRSIAEKSIQAIYRRFVVVMDSVLNPDHLGLALETNLIRRTAPPVLYNSVKLAVNDAASDITERTSNVRLSISVQAEQAWGVFTATDYEGVEQDFADFPFIHELGISSYPYFGFDKPGDLPSNYYKRILAGRLLPVFVTESGWPSDPVPTPNGVFPSSPSLQEEYINKHSELLNSINATAWFQLPFTDIDLAHVPDGTPDNIGYFATIGLVNKSFETKPSLNKWDEIFNRTLH